MSTINEIFAAARALPPAERDLLVNLVVQAQVGELPPELDTEESANLLQELRQARDEYESGADAGVTFEQRCSDMQNTW